MTQVNRAVFQITLDLNLTVFTEFERGTPQYIPLAKETFGPNRIQRGACAQACFQSEVVIDQFSPGNPESIISLDREIHPVCRNATEFIRSHFDTKELSAGQCGPF